MGIEEKPSKVKALFQKRKQAGSKPKAAPRGKPSYQELS